MNNSEAKEILDHNWTKLVNPDYPDEELGEAQSMAIKALEQSEWIPVTERLPDKDGRYLCSYENEFGTCVDFGKFEKNDWWVGRVTAWMPLPEPYKGDTE